MVDYESEIHSIKEALKINNEEHKEIIERLNKKDISEALMRQQLDTLVKTTNRIEGKIDTQNEKIDTQNEKMQKELDTQKEKIQQEINKEKEKPAKRWELIVSTLITTLVGGGVGALVGFLSSHK